MADGEVVYEVRADTSNIDGDLNEANNKVEKGTGKLTQIAGSTAKVVGASFLAVGTAVTGIGALAVKSSNDFDKAMNGFAASTGTAKEDMKKYEGVLKDVYANNYGESFDDIATAMEDVRKNIGDLDDKSFQKVTESAFALRDAFGYEIPESTRAAKAMMDNFGTSSEEALNLIAEGSQNGLDYSGELIDSISEYSSQFGKLGFTADDMFNIFQKGADNGAWNLDKVGDAVKEFSIRAIDGSNTTIDGFTKIGLNADDMASKFAQGGDVAKQAFKDTVTALSEMEDPLAQNAAGVDLFGR